jgi:hypothetical protein
VIFVIEKLFEQLPNEQFIREVDEPLRGPGFFEAVEGGAGGGEVVHSARRIGAGFFFQL